MGFFGNDNNAAMHIQQTESNKLILALLITLVVVKVIEIIVFFTRGFKKTVERTRRDPVV